jgi:hypothetical protein
MKDLIAVAIMTREQSATARQLNSAVAKNFDCSSAGFSGRRRKTLLRAAIAAQAAELGCSRTTVKRYLRQGGWA